LVRSCTEMRTTRAPAGCGEPRYFFSSPQADSISLRNRELTSS
jgi:hypothetical protein